MFQTTQTQSNRLILTDNTEMGCSPDSSHEGIKKYNFVFPPVSLTIRNVQHSLPCSCTPQSARAPIFNRHLQLLQTDLHPSSESYLLGHLLCITFQLSHILEVYTLIYSFIQDSCGRHGSCLSVSKLIPQQIHTAKVSPSERPRGGGKRRHGRH